MEQQTKSLKFLQQRKFLVVLPLLVTPFVTLAFWALGGGRGDHSENNGATASAGMNLNLPGAHLKEDTKADKLAAYEKAASDSARTRDLIRNDPYLTTQFDEHDTAYEQTGLLSGKKYADPNEAKVYAKLDKLNKVVNETASGSNIKSSDAYGNTHAQAPAGRTANGDVYAPFAASENETRSEDAGRLQELMQKLNEKPGSPPTEDTELRQLNGMLDKIMDIQHPERVKERLQSNPSTANKQSIYTVSREPPAGNISLFGGADSSQVLPANTFYGLQTGSKASEQQNAIPAVVPENQTLVNGAEIRLRTLADLWVGGHRVPRDHFIYGTVSLNNERLVVSIKSIQDAGSVYPVKMEVYNLDGQQGIYIPGAITRDVLKQSADNAIQSVALQSLDPSIGAQAASAGIETAKQLLSKKVKLVKVQVKAGYRLLIQTIQ